MKKMMKRLMKNAATVVAAVCMLGVTTRSAGQGTMGTVPEPMSTAEVMRYADRLGLSHAQRQAVETLHDEYKAKFKALREGEIEEMLERMKGLESNGGMPSRKSVEEWAKAMDEVRVKIQRVDNTFFDGMQGMLTEAQLGHLGRVKQQRERQRCGTNIMTRGLLQGMTDLTDDYLDLKLSAEEGASTAEVMNQYESALTGLMKKFETESSNFFVKIYDALEARGINEESMKDPAKVQEMMGLLQEAMREATADLMKQGAEMSALNKRTFKSLQAGLPAEKGRALRTAYLAKAYQELWYANNDGAGPRIEAALKMEGVTEAEAEQLGVLRADHQRELDRLVDRGVDAVDEFRKGRSPMDFDNDAWQEHNKKMGELQAEVQKEQEGTFARLKEIMGEERSERLAADTAEKAVETKAEVMAALEGGAVAATEVEVEAEEEGDGSWGPDTFLPAAIGERELKAYVRRTGLTEDQSAVMAGIHEEYKEKWKSLDEHEVKAVLDAVQHQWQYDKETGTSTPPTEEKTDELYRRRTAALEGILKADEWFFNEVETMALGKGEEGILKPARWMRARQTYNRMHNYGWFGGNTAEAGIDVYQLMLASRMGKDEMKKLDGALRAYEEEAVKRMRELYEASVAGSKQQEKFQAELQRRQADGTFNGMDYQEMMKTYFAETQEKSKAARSRLVELNRTTVKQLAEAMESGGSAFEAKYRVQANPQVYGDGTCMENAVLAAMRLGSLSEDQRRELEGLSAEYRPAYAAKCDEMVGIMDGMDMGMMTGGDPEGWRVVMEKQQKLQKLRFERGELSQRALAKLQRILSEEQLKQVGPLPDAKAFEEAQNAYNW